MASPPPQKKSLQWHPNSSQVKAKVSIVATQPFTIWPPTISLTSSWTSSPTYCSLTFTHPALLTTPGTYHTCFCLEVFTLPVPWLGSLFLQICMWLPTHFLPLFVQTSPHQSQHPWPPYIKQRPPSRNLALSLSVLFLFHSPYTWRVIFYLFTVCIPQQNVNSRRVGILPIFFMAESPLATRGWTHSGGSINI